MAADRGTRQRATWPFSRTTRPCNVPGRDTCLSRGNWQRWSDIPMPPAQPPHDQIHCIGREQRRRSTGHTHAHRRGWCGSQDAGPSRSIRFRRTDDSLRRDPRRRFLSSTWFQSCRHERKRYSKHTCGDKAIQDGRPLLFPQSTALQQSHENVIILDVPPLMTLVDGDRTADHRNHDQRP